MSAPFELRNVTVTLGETVALRDVTLEIPRGVTTGLIGPSGGGKSTLLRALMGLVFPSQGAVWREGKPVEPADWVPLRRRLGYVLQGGGLFPHLSARANVILLPRSLGWSRARLEGKVSELASTVQLPLPLLEQRPGALSGGQRQRVALMRALMLDPEVLLLDEPLGALDPVTRLGLQDELRELFARLGRTVVLVTHDLAEAAFLAQRLVLLREGAVLQAGSPQELVQHPAHEYVRRFVEAQRRPLLPEGAGA